MRRNLFVSLGFVTVAAFLLIASCRKINMATDVGQDLIPEVDNIHTFDTIVEVQTFNHIFTAAIDTFNSVPSDAQYLGWISNDPIFGKSDARLFFQLLPMAGKRTLSGSVPSRQIDSVILSLPYFETYGDSTIAQSLEVSEIAQNAQFEPSPYSVTNLNQVIYKRDSAYSIRSNNYPLAGVLGSKTIVPQTLKDSVVIIRKDTSRVANRIRIRLNNSFGQRLLNYDTTGVNDAYSSDTAFNSKFKGFALKSTAGNALLGVWASGASMTIFYRYTDAQSALKDTTATFGFSSPGSAYANYIGRDYSGTQVATTSNDNTTDGLLYLQNTPGTYTLLKIPALAGMSNRIIHLAQLQAESVYDASDSMFYAPKLFIDAYNSSTGKNLNLPFVFNEFTMTNAGGINDVALGLFGSMYGHKKDAAGNPIKQWLFNLTRYVQNVVNRNTPSYDLRLYAKPFVNMVDTVYYNGAKIAQPHVPISIVQSRKTTSIAPGVGRVRVGGGAHPTQKMKMRIVYSRL